MQPQIRDRWRNKDGSKTARDGKGLRWQLVYEDLNGNKHYPTFARKEDAKAKLAEVAYDLNRGRSYDPNDPTTVLQWVEKFVANKNLRPSTEQINRSFIKIHVAPTPLGKRPIVKVRTSDVQAWATSRAKVMSPLKLRILVTLIRGAFTAAVHDHMISDTPFQRIQLPKVPRGRIVPLTVKQVRALAEHIGEPYQAMVIAQAGLGLRLGELLVMRMEDVDWMRRTVKIEFQLDRNTRELAPLKTHGSRRTVPMPSLVGMALAEHVRKFPTEENGFLFPMRRGLFVGQPMRRNGYGAKHFKLAVRAAGLPADTTTHDLRHHFASVLLAAGESVIAVAERLGHDDASLVMSTYGHLMPDQEDRTRKAIDGAWAAEDEAVEGDAGETRWPK